MSRVPFILPDFLDKETCNQLCVWAEHSQLWEVAQPPWDQRCINLRNMEEHIRNQVCDIYSKTKQKLQEYWHPEVEQHGDLFGIVRWRPGDRLEPPHADAENADGSLHPFAHREYAAIIYLNEEYTGGQLYFSKLQMIPEITIGTLAIFPGTLEYMHGVTPVKSGMRYTISGFFTSQKQYADQYLI